MLKKAKHIVRGVYRDGKQHRSGHGRDGGDGSEDEYDLDGKHLTTW